MTEFYPNIPFSTPLVYNAHSTYSSLDGYFRTLKVHSAQKHAFVLELADVNWDIAYQWTFLLTRINFYPNMNKQILTLKIVGWDYLSIHR